MLLSGDLLGYHLYPPQNLERPMWPWPLKYWPGNVSTHRPFMGCICVTYKHNPWNRQNEPQSGHCVHGERTDGRCEATNPPPPTPPPTPTNLVVRGGIKITEVQYSYFHFIFRHHCVCLCNDNDVLVCYNSISHNADFIGLHRKMRKGTGNGCQVISKIYRIDTNLHLWSSVYSNKYYFRIWPSLTKHCSECIKVVLYKLWL